MRKTAATLIAAAALIAIPAVSAHADETAVDTTTVTTTQTATDPAPAPAPGGPLQPMGHSWT